MKYIINNINQKSQIIFFFLIFYGLSFSIFLKELNLIFIRDFDFEFIIIYRLLIIIFSFSLLYPSNYKFNFFALLLIFLNLIFIYNSFFGEKIQFSIESKTFYNNLDISYDQIEKFFDSKNKIFLINFFNILLPLIALMFYKKSNFKIEEFKNKSLKICNFFLYLIFFFLIYKFVLIKLKFIKYSEAFINIHSLIYILNIHFLLIIDLIKKNEKKLNYQNIINIILIISCLFLSGTSIHFIICLLTLIFYFFKKIKFLYFLSISFILLILISFSELFYFESEQIISIFDYFQPGTLANSVYVRIMNINYFLFYSENFNILLGNNIFVDNIYTYPHNIFIDIYICTGLVGIIIIILILLNFIIKFKNQNKENLFILILLIQSFIFSNLSGFFFTNIIFNIALAASFCFLKEKEVMIKKNS